MDRRNFVKAGVAAATLVATGSNAEVPVRKKYNVLYIFDDQHRFQAFPGPHNDTPRQKDADIPRGGTDAIAMPNLAQFRENSISMDRCVSNYPLCAPHRGILMSGRYPFQNGVIQNGIALNPSTTPNTITSTFAQNGYYVGYVGKWHLSGGMDATFVPAGPSRFGVADWHVWANTDTHYYPQPQDDAECFTFDQNTGQKLTPGNGWIPTDMTAQAREFLISRANLRDSGQAAEPWMLFVSWNPPHPPYNPPSNDVQEDHVGQPYRANVQLSGSNPSPYLQSDSAYIGAAQNYFGGITGIDGEFGALLDSLAKNGFADDTIVIFTSDHGDMMGSHGLIDKIFPYEESCRVPLLVRYPGAQPRHSHELFASIDIFPTLCGLVGIDVPSTCSGHDLSEVILQAHTENPRKYAFLLSAADGMDFFGAAQVECPNYRGLRDDQYTYAVTQQGRWLMFDNAADPYQMNNLVESTDPAILAKMSHFDTLIKNWLATNPKDPFPYPDTAA